MGFQIHQEEETWTRWRQKRLGSGWARGRAHWFSFLESCFYLENKLARRLDQGSREMTQWTRIPVVFMEGWYWFLIPILSSSQLPVTLVQSSLYTNRRTLNKGVFSKHWLKEDHPPNLHSLGVGHPEMTE